MTTLASSENALSIGFWLAGLFTVLAGTMIGLQLPGPARRVPVLARRSRAKPDDRL